MYTRISKRGWSETRRFHLLQWINISNGWENRFMYTFYIDLRETLENNYITLQSSNTCHIFNGVMLILYWCWMIHKKSKKLSLRVNDISTLHCFSHTSHMAMQNWSIRHFDVTVDSFSLMTLFINVYIFHIIVWVYILSDQIIYSMTMFVLIG